MLRERLRERPKPCKKPKNRAFSRKDHSKGAMMLLKIAPGFRRGQQGAMKKIGISVLACTGSNVSRRREKNSRFKKKGSKRSSRKKRRGGGKGRLR